MSADREYLDFVETGDTGKTKMWDVMSLSGGYRLGRIRWHGPWRQYVFFPEAETLWNSGRLRSVRLFLVSQMELRAVSRGR